MKTAIHMFIRPTMRGSKRASYHIQQVAGGSLRDETMFGYNPTQLTHVILGHTILIPPNVLIQWDTSLSLSD